MKLNSLKVGSEVFTLSIEWNLTALGDSKTAVRFEITKVYVRSYKRGLLEGDKFLEDENGYPIYNYERIFNHYPTEREIKKCLIKGFKEQIRWHMDEIARMEKSYRFCLVNMGKLLSKRCSIKEFGKWKRDH